MHPRGEGSTQQHEDEEADCGHAKTTGRRDNTSTVSARVRYSQVAAAGRAPRGPRETAKVLV